MGTITMDEEAGHLWRMRVRDVLNREWDPIGIRGDPVDEYDPYVLAIASMIQDRSVDSTLLRYMEWAEVDSIGLSPFKRDRAHKVIAILRALAPPPKEMIPGPKPT
jgi:hypothetical protein